MLEMFFGALNVLQVFQRCANDKGIRQWWIHGGVGDAGPLLGSNFQQKFCEMIGWVRVPEIYYV